MGSTLPSEMGEAMLLLNTGWSWQDLQETPLDIVDNVHEYLAAKARVDRANRRKK